MKSTKIALLLTFILSIIVYSCESMEESEPQVTERKSNYKLEWAVEQANAAVLMFEKSTRSTKNAVIKDVKVIVNQESRGIADTLIYVVNYPNDEGFSLISAVNPENPLLAYIPKGHFNPEIGTDNPGFNLFLDVAVEEASAVAGKVIGPIEKDSTETDLSAVWIVDGKYRSYLTTTLVDEKLLPKFGYDFKWGQDGIYGAECPNFITGCGPLAIASIATYFNAKNNKNTNVTFNYNQNNIETIPVDWSELFAHKYTNGYNIYDCHETNVSATHSIIAKLCRQIGFECEANYLLGGTSITSANINSVLNKYTYGCFASGDLYFTEGAPRKYLPEGVLMMFGVYTDSNQGHIWVCDGYKYKKTRTDLRESPMGLNGYLWTTISSTFSESTYSYMHWGWHGDSDGWYYGTVFTYNNQEVPFAQIRFRYIRKKLEVSL